MGARGNDAKRRRIKKRLACEQAYCWLCGYPLDPTAPPFTDWATEIDELLPFSRGGSGTDQANTKLAHRWCNLQRSNALLDHRDNKGRIVRPGYLAEAVREYRDSLKPEVIETTVDW